MQTHQGIIVVYNQAKAWGFIRELSGAEWFFHMANTAPEFVPQLGAAVEFEIGPPLSVGKKEQALSVREVKS
jgi:cold shock CspA family protein